MLSVEALEVAYGKIQVIWGVSFSVEPGETVAIVGPNGAGKTTLLKTLAGLLAPRAGRIVFERRDIGGLAAQEIARHGLALVPEGRELFPYMSVDENLQLGARLQRDRARTGETLEWVSTLFPRLRERGRQMACTLSGGEQQMLAIGRALMGRPRLLVLDEPSTGLSPIAVERLFAVIRRLGAGGTTTLLVEQNVSLALETSDRAYVLERGRVVREGAARELAGDPVIAETYLGGPAVPGR